MAVPIIRRRNAGIFPWLRALAFGGCAYLALAALPFYPSALTAVMALVIGALGLFSPGLGVFVFLLALAVPLVAGNLIVAAVVLVLGFAGLHYLSDEDASKFLVVALAFAATIVKAEWGIAVLAGYLFGAGEGATLAFVACLLIEGTGLMLGIPSIGTLATGGSLPLVDLKALAAIKDPLAGGWLPSALTRANPHAFFDVITSARDLGLVALQPLLWAAAAGVAGGLRRPVGHPQRLVRAFAAALGGAVALGVVTLGASMLLRGPVPLQGLALGLAAALLVAFAGIAASEWLFKPVMQKRGMDAEEADVDELLRMISSAEEKLASKHTVHKTVLITDMKSFSRLTEDLGSTETAKLVQRHRDLLLPIIEKSRGHGKSTGGDGLLAAFDNPSDAITAAVQMQRSLDAYNSSRPGGEVLLIRAGIASGEVVLDKGGKPFLGGALNLAARVMSLADGGQVFTTRSDMDAASTLPHATASHGEFRLKNIAEPVHIVEVMWGEHQEARAPYLAAAE